MMIGNSAMKRILPVVFFSLCIAMHSGAQTQPSKTMPLPDPVKSGDYSFEELCWKRGSLRDYKEQTPGWESIGQILWAAQGINRPEKNGRTAPSAWGTYPLELYVIRPDGVFHYLPQSHSVEQIKEGDSWGQLGKNGLGKSIVHQSPCVFVFTADISRAIPVSETIADTERYIYLEAGHAAQNLLLQAIALGMGGVPIGANITLGGQQAIGIPANEKPVYLIATGIPQDAN